MRRRSEDKWELNKQMREEKRQNSVRVEQEDEIKEGVK
jgi:hypothetical protein